jgi:hypothetical protein
MEAEKVVRVGAGMVILLPSFAGELSPSYGDDLGGVHLEAA